MISLKRLHTIAVACHLLEPPASVVVIELLEEIKRLQSKLRLIQETSTESIIQELATEDIYDDKT